MCGIVSYFGPNNGVERVLSALELLTYRAPDSSGLAVLAADGELAVRQAVGTAVHLKNAIAANPLPPLRQSDMQVVVGHGRWAMVGAVTTENTHPIGDRSQDRVACENGSHNATLMLEMMAEQAEWWRERGIPAETVHRTQNTTEVLTYEWERMATLLAESALPADSAEFVAQLDEWAVTDVEERALRLAMWRLRAGNAHACAFYSRHRPDTLYVTSHHKPIAIIARTDENGRQEIMVASDVNAALMLWSGDEVDTAVSTVEALQASHADQPRINAILDEFRVDVIYLDNDIYQGEELLARITHDDRAQPQIIVTRYDGTPIAVSPQSIRLNPTMVGKKGHDTYTENHIAEIPDVMDAIVQAYIQDGQLNLDSIWEDGELLWPGLNGEGLHAHFGARLEKLGRLLLIGEGSSWRDAQAAAPMFREMLPGVLVNVYSPIQVLNLGPAIDPAHDLALEISWSGTTDSLLKVDRWLAQMGVMRVAITGRPQSDLGRRAARSGGVLNVHTGVEVSVATVKGYEAILMTLYLLALHLSERQSESLETAVLSHLLNELTFVVPQRVRAALADTNRQRRIRQTAVRCRNFNKVAVVGNSPVDIEAELKIEELAQIVARTSDFHDADLRALIERSALVGDDRQRTLFIINATTAEAQWEAQFIINYLRELDVFCLVHTTPHDRLDEWRALSNTAVFVSPHVSDSLQSLVDAPFFFELAVALAYARGLSPDEIDRPRNLAKSVTTTGAERRALVEARREFHIVDLQAFNDGRLAHTAWDLAQKRPSRAALRATVALRAAVAVIAQPLPGQLALNYPSHLVVATDTKAIENAAYMAAATWHELLGIDLIVYRRFISELPEVSEDTVLLRMIRAGAVLAVRDEQTVALPSDLAPLQQELLGSVYLIGLAVRLARQRGVDMALWEAGMAQLPLVVAEILADTRLAREVNDALKPFVGAGYDKVQLIGGGQDYAAAISMARSLRARGFMAEALYTDSAWHGPLATVGGPDAEHDALIVILATDPLFQAAALVDTQVYRTRHAKIILVVPEGNENLPAVQGVGASAVVAVTAVPRPFLPVTHAAFGDVLARQMAQLWEEREA
ncbi:MAG: hypothetical protein GY803_07720 [Chloroflexi bacterium]|nr:hypothetical protein [Chloroflexota bacterium]